MFIEEGQTTSQTVDLRATELAIIDRSDPELDKFTVVPGAQLSEGTKVSDERLPFDIETIAYYPNSQITRYRGGKNIATAGFGTEWQASSLPVSTGTDPDAKPVDQNWVRT
jgi:hypothetical protein